MRSFTVTLEVPDHMRVAIVRSKSNGSWEVSVCDAGGILGAWGTGYAPTPSEACEAALEQAQPIYEAAKSRWDAAQEAAAARLAAGVTKPSGGGARPTGEPLRRSGAVVVGWDGPVPRNAAHWEAQRTATGELSGIRVILHEGLYFDGGVSEKTFKTLRQAKDETRAASSVKQGSLFY